MMQNDAEKDLLVLNGYGKHLRKVQSKSGRASRRPVPVSRMLLRWFEVLVVAGGLVLVLRWALEPYCTTWLLDYERPALVERKAAALDERTGLDWALRHAQSEKGATALARDYGYLKPGEVPMLPPEREKLQNTLPAAAPDQPTLGERFMLLVCRVCGAGPRVVEPEREATAR